MQRGILFKIVLIILILGISIFLYIRNKNLRTSLENGEIASVSMRDYLPFGGDKVREDLPEENLEDNILNGETIEALPGQKTKEISSQIAGMIVIERNDETKPINNSEGDSQKPVYEKITAIRYVSKENGYVYDYIPKYKKSYLISDTLVPRVMFATFSNDGEQILFQYLANDLKTEKSILGRLGDPKVIFLPDNIISYAFGNNGEFAYFRKTNDNSGALFIVGKDGKENLFYSSPLSEWNVSFMGDDLLITTKPTELAPGYSYILDKQTKKLNRLWANINGLTTKVSSSGKYILYSESTSRGPNMYLYERDIKKTTNIGKMGLVDKCSFSKDETIFVCATPKAFENVLYPDAWYLGEIKTSDVLIKYTTQNLNRTILGSRDDLLGDIDVFDISVNNAGSIIGLISKQDMSLFSYEE